MLPSAPQFSLLDIPPPEQQAAMTQAQNQLIHRLQLTNLRSEQQPLYGASLRAHLQVSSRPFPAASLQHVPLHYRVAVVDGDGPAFLGARADA